MTMTYMHHQSRDPSSTVIVSNDDYIIFFCFLLYDDKKIKYFLFEYQESKTKKTWIPTTDIKTSIFRSLACPAKNQISLWSSAQFIFSSSILYIFFPTIQNIFCKNHCIYNIIFNTLFFTLFDNMFVGNKRKGGHHDRLLRLLVEYECTKKTFKSSNFFYMGLPLLEVNPYEKVSTLTPIFLHTLAIHMKSRSRYPNFLSNIL